MPPRSPQDDYSPVQSVEPVTGAPQDYLDNHSNPNQFGAQIGEAVQKGGSALEEAGNKTIETALQYQQIQNEATANTAVQGYAKYASDAEMNLRKLQGQNAINALPAYQQGMEETLQKTASQIQSPMARNAFMTDARNFYNRSLYSAGIYVGDEAKKNVLMSYQGKIKAIDDFTTLHYNDPKAVSDGVQNIVNSTLSIAQQQGITDSDTVHSMVSKNVGGMLDNVIVAQMSQGTTLHEQAASLKTAQGIFQQLKDASIPGSPGVPMLDAQQQDQLASKLQYRDLLISNKLERQQDLAAAHYAVTIRANIQNSTAMLEQGITPQGIPSDGQIAAAYPKNPEMAQVVMDQAAGLRDMAHATTSLSGATPEQVLSMRNAVRPDPNKPDFAGQVRRERAFDAVLNQRQALLRKDPAAYVLSTNSDLTPALQAGLKDPQAFTAYATATQTHQSSMGIPQLQQHVLPSAVATSMVNDISSDPKTAGGKLTQYEQKFGHYWPQVYRDMTTLGGLSPQYQAVAVLPEQDGTTLSRVLAEKASGKDIADLLPAKGGAAVKTNITDKFFGSQFERSLVSQGNSPTQVSAIRNSIISLAYGNAYYNNMSPGDAVKSAWDSFTKNYDYIGSARVPADKVSNISQNAGVILSGLDESKVSIPHNLGGTGVSRQEYLDTLKSAPNWVTAPDAKSLWLMDIGGRIVRDNHGNPLSVPFDAPPPTSAPYQQPANSMIEK